MVELNFQPCTMDMMAVQIKTEEEFDQLVNEWHGGLVLKQTRKYHNATYISWYVTNTRRELIEVNPGDWVLYKKSDYARDAGFEVVHAEDMGRYVHLVEPLAYLRKEKAMPRRKRRIQQPGVDFDWSPGRADGFQSNGAGHGYGQASGSGYGITSGPGGCRHHPAGGGDGVGAGLDMSNLKGDGGSNGDWVAEEREAGDGFGGGVALGSQNFSLDKGYGIG